MADKIQETRLSSHGLTSKSRMYPTKQGKWTRDGIQDKTYEEWTQGFTAANCESRNRPNFGIQELAHTLLLAEPLLMEGVEKGVYGGAVQLLLKKIQENKTGLEQLDGASTATKSPQSINVGVKATILWLQALATMKKFKELLPFLFLQGEVLRHCSQQLAEWTSAVSDSKGFVAAIGNKSDQPCHEALRMWQQKKTGSDEKMIEYFSGVLGGALKKNPAKTPAKVSQSLAAWDEESTEKAKDEENTSSGEEGEAAEDDKVFQDLKAKELLRSKSHKSKEEVDEEEHQPAETQKRKKDKKEKKAKDEESEVRKCKEEVVEEEHLAAETKKRKKDEKEKKAKDEESEVPTAKRQKSEKPQKKKKQKVEQDD